MKRVAVLALVSLASIALVACSADGVDRASDGPEVPQPDTTAMEPQVKMRLREVREGVLAEPLSAEAWGLFGRVAHAHELWPEAAVAYRRAQELDPEDERWPYFLGDVLSVVGDDPAGTERAFRRALELRSDYGPAHFRLGKALQAEARFEEASAALERALELQPDLLPARVALAQVRIGQDRLDEARDLLEDVLEEAPRHPQALSALGQVYQRTGRREEAREVADRARDATSYTLFSDPLMSEVVGEGRSSIAIWERARAFLDNGNWVQAEIGLREVLKIQPDNPDVHHQLALAYRGRGNLERARHHLEQTVRLVPDRVDAKVQLAMLHAEQGDPAAALPLLATAADLAPDDPEIPWLLARVQLQTGDHSGALARFESAAASGAEIPIAARIEWGNALAQAGRLDDALKRFEEALAQDPGNAQAHFFSGLATEALGRSDEAILRYCRSMAASPNPPAASRLSALGATCP